MDLTKLNVAYKPTATDISNGGFVDVVVFEMQVLRTMTMDLVSATPLEAHLAKTVTELKSALSVRLQTLIRGHGCGRQLLNRANFNLSSSHHNTNSNTTETYCEETLRLFHDTATSHKA
jgi:hypothetical protein